MKCENRKKYKNKQESLKYFLEGALRNIVSFNNFFFIWRLKMAFIAICYMYIDLFALQHIAERPGELYPSYVRRHVYAVFSRLIGCYL